MLFAYSYPLLSVFWSLLMFAGLLLWIFIVIWCFIDNFRRRDHHGLAKALWFRLHRFCPPDRRYRLSHRQASRCRFSLTWSHWPVWASPWLMRHGTARSASGASHSIGAGTEVRFWRTWF